MTVGVLLGVVLGAAIGFAVGFVWRAHRQVRAVAESQAAEARLADALARMERSTDEAKAASARAAELEVDKARLSEQLEHERRHSDERAAAWEETRHQLLAEFARLSGQALANNNEQFLALADQRLKEAHQSAAGDLAQRQQAIEALVAPLREQLGRYEQGVVTLERNRQDAYRGLIEQVHALGQSHDQLQRETKNLATALRSPSARGRWGELQLRKVVEMAGMVEHCDFDVQVVADGDDGRLRPDLIARLPGGKQVVVDAKVPLEAFQAAVEAESEDERRLLFASHARQVRAHVEALSKKAYWRQFEPSPEFVVAFIPGDPLLGAALEHDPSLIEYAVANNVLLATPVTLISLLRAVSYGWQQEALAENARAVQQLGKQLYERLASLGGHLNKVGRHLTGAVEAFNDAIGSMESRVLVSARRFPEMGVVGEREKDLPVLEPVVASARAVQAPELMASAAAESDDRAELRALPSFPDLGPQDQSTTR
ncbi:MAG TPA: DNA recombination protein RmuC [Acidimicrobiales bacterium]|nr:DNA recombination protein RmuC [Acidimicrobiales bacterium]